MKRLINVLLFSLLVGEAFSQVIYDKKSFNGNFIYLLDTVKVQNAFRIKISDSSGTGQVYLFNMTLLEADSILLRYKYDFNELINQGYPLKQHRTFISYFANACNTNKFKLLNNYSNQNENYYLGHLLKTVKVDGKICELFLMDTNCFLLCLINQGFYNSDVDFDQELKGGKMKFDRIGFPVKCKDL